MGAQARPVTTPLLLPIMLCSRRHCFTTTYQLIQSMTVLGLVGDEVNKWHFVCEDELIAVAHYVGKFVSGQMRIATYMARGVVPVRPL